MLMPHDCSGMISLRHYSISVAPSGLKKSLKTLLQHKALPKMGEFQDVSEFIMKSGYGSVRAPRIMCACVQACVRACVCVCVRVCLFLCILFIKTAASASALHS
jgi:hypothetical protein